MDDEQNDFDRIAERIAEVRTVLWSAEVVLARDNDVASNLVPFALETATRKLTTLQDWVEGISATIKKLQE